MTTALDSLTLADSSLPTGGYAFSGGLEAAWQMGLLPASTDLHGYLETTIRAAAHSELPFVQSCYTDERIPAELEDMLATYDAMLTAPTMIQASRVLGRNLLRLMCALYPSPEMHGLRQTWRKCAWPTHHTLVYGATCRIAGFARDDARRIFLYQGLRDQISAAVRLGILGPIEAATTQKAHHATCESALDATVGLSYTDAVRTAPQWEIAQSFHQHLYSRLFQS